MYVSVCIISIWCMYMHMLYVYVIYVYFCVVCVSVCLCLLYVNVQYMSVYPDKTVNVIQVPLAPFQFCSHPRHNTK